MLIKKIFLATLITLAANLVQANDFNVSGQWEFSNNRQARNIGITISETDAHVTLKGKIQHNSGFLIEATVGNGNDNWSLIKEYAVGWAGKINDNWLLRTDLFRIELNGDARPDQTVDSVRAGLINTSGDWRPFVFGQKFKEGSLPGDGFAIRPGTKWKNLYGEFTLTHDLLGERGTDVSSATFGWIPKWKEFKFNISGTAERLPEQDWRLNVSFTHPVVWPF